MENRISAKTSLKFVKVKRLLSLIYYKVCLISAQKIVITEKIIYQLVMHSLNLCISFVSNQSLIKAIKSSDPQMKW